MIDRTTILNMCATIHNPYPIKLLIIVTDRLYDPIIFMRIVSEYMTVFMEQDPEPCTLPCYEIWELWINKGIRKFGPRNPTTCHDQQMPPY